MGSQKELPNTLLGSHLLKVLRPAAVMTTVNQQKEPQTSTSRVFNYCDWLKAVSTILYKSK